MYLEQQQQEADLTWLGALGCTWVLVQVGLPPHLLLIRREFPHTVEKYLPLQLVDILLSLCGYYSVGLYSLLLPPKLQRRGLVFKRKMVTMKRV